MVWDFSEELCRQIVIAISQCTHFHRYVNDKPICEQRGRGPWNFLDLKNFWKRTFLVDDQEDEIRQC